MANPTYYYFGGSPTTVVLQTSDNFSGAAYNPAIVPVITPGLAALPSQAGGGLFNLHLRPVKIKRIDFVGAGSVIVTLELPTVSVPVATLSPSTSFYEQDLILPVGAGLKFVSSGTAGTKSVSITGLEAGPDACL